MIEKNSHAYLEASYKDAVAIFERARKMTSDYRTLQICCVVRDWLVSDLEYVTGQDARLRYHYTLKEIDVVLQRIIRGLDTENTSRH